jgi:hypothetical protein
LLEFDGVTEGRSLELSTDTNDWYEVTFYRRGSALGRAQVERRTGSHGMRTSTLRPPTAARSGYDAVGVLPLFGDGRYSLGHVLAR